MKTKKVFEAMDKGKLLDMMTPPTVWVAVIERPGGSLVFASQTEDGLRRKVADWCLEWWNEDDLEERPQDPRQVINTYFDQHELDDHFLTTFDEIDAD